MYSTLTNPSNAIAINQSVNFAVARFVQETLAQNHGDIYYRIQVAVDRAVLREVLGHVKGNQVEAADLLGISRTTLRSKLRSLGLVVEKQVSPSSPVVDVSPCVASRGS